MKIKVILIIILFVVIAISSIKYIDLCIYKKYETQLEGLSPTKEQLEEVNNLEKKIDGDKKIAFSIIVLSLVAIYPISLMKK
ncbi:hypothetical protein A4A95_RS14530 [Elizabethkingia anophelis]|nr:hypothetical protein [Elizabethkingia anophelis]